MCQNPRRTSACLAFSHFTPPQQPHSQILTDKANTLNKISVPIKEYSNKFFRQSQGKLMDPPIKKIETQKRFNVIFKKKQLLSKNHPKISLFEDQSIQISKTKPEDIIKVSRVSHEANKKRVKTQAAGRCSQNCQTNPMVLTQLQSELLLSSTLLSNLLNPQSTNFRETINLKYRREEISNKRKSCSVWLPSEQKQKISQSRGLEYYSKIFMRNRSQIMQKEKDSQPHKHTTYPWQTITANHFQTRRIFPVNKSKRAIQIDRKLLMNTSNHKSFSSNRTRHYKTLEQEQENFELRGWQTTT